MSLKDIKNKNVFAERVFQYSLVALMIISICVSIGISNFFIASERIRTEKLVFEIKNAVISVNQLKSTQQALLRVMRDDEQRRKAIMNLQKQREIKADKIFINNKNLEIRPNQSASTPEDDMPTLE